MLKPNIWVVLLQLQIKVQFSEVGECHKNETFPPLGAMALASSSVNVVSSGSGYEINFNL